MKQWTRQEDAILEAHYPQGGALACRKYGLTRSQQAMKARAEKLGIQSPRKFKRRKDAEQPAWALPAQDLLQSLDCIRLRKWRGPVDRERALRWAA